MAITVSLSVCLSSFFFCRLFLFASLLPCQLDCLYMWCLQRFVSFHFLFSSDVVFRKNFHFKGFRQQQQQQQHVSTCVQHFGHMKFHRNYLCHRALNILHLLSDCLSVCRSVCLSANNFKSPL